MKGVKHYTRDGKEWKGSSHKMPNGSVHTNKSHTKTSVKLLHFKGQSPSGGLNAKGRASAKKEGSNLKPPVTESNPKGKKKKRKASFCARMRGMRKRQKPSNNTGKDRLSLSLKKWKC